jgi:hypothetical protein
MQSMLPRISDWRSTEYIMTSIFSPLSAENCHCGDGSHVPSLMCHEVRCRIDLWRASWCRAYVALASSFFASTAAPHAIRRAFCSKRESNILEINMKKIGIVSIERTINTNILSFDEMYASVGMNTGNFMFTEAVYRQLNADTQCIGFSYNPEKANKELDHIVIPAANWINSYSDWGWLCDILEKTHIPVTVVGLGIQNDNNNIDNFQASVSSIRLAKILSQKSPLISVRGQVTKSYLQNLGIKNSIVTGCPSLYMRLDDYKNSIDKRESIVIQSTRYGMSKKFLQEDSINNSLFAICKKLDADMVLQSEIEEIMILVKQDSEARDISDNVLNYLSELYGFERRSDFFDFLRQRCRVFFDVNHWSNFLRDRYGVIGTRLHGAIIALNSGVPALLIPHDSRTSEMANFAGIPTLAASEAASLNTLEEAKEKLSHADVKKFQATRARNGIIYRSFLTACNLPYREEALF